LPNFDIGPNRYKCIENHYDQDKSWVEAHNLGENTSQITFPGKAGTKMFGYDCTGNGTAKSDNELKFPSQPAITANSQGDFSCKTVGSNAVVTYNHPYGKLSRIIGSGT